MSIPLLSLPSFLSNFSPQLEELHQNSAIGLATGCAVFGMFILMLWSVALWGGDNPNTELPFGGTIKNRMQLGIGLLAVSVLSLVFGLYLGALLTVGLVIFLGFVLYTAVKEVFGRNSAAIK